MHSNFASPKNIASLALLFLAIIAIGWVAAWSARNTPIDNVQSTFANEDIVLSSHQLHKETLLYITNIKTGKTLFRRFIGYPGNLGWDESNGWLTSLSIDENRVTRQQCNYDDEQPLSSAVLTFDLDDYWNLRANLSSLGKFILRVKFDRVESIDRLESYDGTSGKLLDSKALVGLTFGPGSTAPFATRSSLRVSFKPFRPVLPPNRVIVRDVGNSQNCELFEVGDDGKLTSLTKWTAIDCHTFRIADRFYVASLTPLGMTIEVRSATDGNLFSSTTLSTDPSVRVPLTMILSYRDGSWIGEPTFTPARDIFTGRELPVPSQFELIERDVENKKLIAISNARRFDIPLACAVIDELTGTELVRFPVDPMCREAKLINNANELAIATSDLRVLTYDVSNGQLLRTINPYGLVRWSKYAVGIAFLIWCFWWVRFFAKLHPYAWLDVSVCAALFLSFLTYSSYNDVNFLFPNRLFMFGLGALLGMTYLTILWAVLSRSRLSLRWMPMLVLFGLAEGLVAWWVPMHATERIESNLVPAIGLVTVALICLTVPLRWLPVRFWLMESNLHGQQLADSERLSRIDLRDIFLMTIVCAIILSIFRWIPSTHWYAFAYSTSPNSPFALARTRFIIACSTLVVLFVCLGLFGLWISLSQRKHVWVRGLAASVVLFGVCEWIVPTTMIFLTPERMLVIFALNSAYFACLIGFYACRARGWRMLLASDRRGGCC